MIGEEVATHHTIGLKRSAHYLVQVQAALDGGKYPPFQKAMEKIVEYGVTIEQEVFLAE